MTSRGTLTATRCANCSATTAQLASRACARGPPISAAGSKRARTARKSDLLWRPTCSTARAGVRVLPRDKSHSNPHFTRNQSPNLSLISFLRADPNIPTPSPTTTTRTSGGGSGDIGGGSSLVVWILVGVVSFAIVLVAVGAATFWFFKIRTPSASTRAESFVPQINLSKI